MNNARLLKYVWPFYNIMHKRVKHLFSERDPVTVSNMLFSCISLGEHFKSVIDNHHLLHKILTVKDDKDQHFNYRQPKVGLQIFHNTTKMGLIYKTLKVTSAIKR